MRWVWLALLAGCVAEAAPPFGGGADGPPVVDEDDMVSDSATKVPTQQSVKAYVDTAILGVGGGPTIIVDDTLAGCQATTPAEGDLCFPTDSPYSMIGLGNGSWRYRYPGIGFDVTLPPSASWTAFNSGSVTSAGGTRTLTVPAETSAGGWRGEYRARVSDPTSAPYCFDAVFRVPWTGAASGNGALGVMFTDATGVAAGYSGGANAMEAIRFSSATAFAGTDATVAGFSGSLYGISGGEDATERHFYSLDVNTGTKTELAGGFDRTTTITATSIGWAALGSDADLARRVELVHWREYACTP